MPYASINDAELHYELSGSHAPAIVLIHGGLCNLSDYVNQMRGLSGEFTVLAVDLRCHGQSNAPFETCSIQQFASDTIALIEHLGLAPALIVGHSMGSRVVTEMAARRPEVVGGLVLLDGSRVWGGDSAMAVAQEIRQENGDRPEAQILLMVGPNATHEVRKHIVDTMTSVPAELTAAVRRLVEDWDVNDADAALASIPKDMPVLAIQSTYYDLATPRYVLTSETEDTPFLERLRKYVPQVQASIVPHVGHFTMLEAPDKVTAVLRDFARAVRSTAQL